MCWLGGHLGNPQGSQVVVLLVHFNYRDFSSCSPEFLWYCGETTGRIFRTSQWHSWSLKCISIIPYLKGTTPFLDPAGCYPLVKSLISRLWKRDAASERYKKGLYQLLPKTAVRVWSPKNPTNWVVESPYGCFQEIGVPQNGWFIMEHPIKMDDLGVPLFSETPI